MNGVKKGTAKNQREIQAMKTLEEIREAKASGNYYAVSRRGKKYEAAYTTEYGGVMFFCIPREEEIIGYEERGAQNGNNNAI